MCGGVLCCLVARQNPDVEGVLLFGGRDGGGGGLSQQPSAHWWLCVRVGCNKRLLALPVPVVCVWCAAGWPRSMLSGRALVLTGASRAWTSCSRWGTGSTAGARRGVWGTLCVCVWVGQVMCKAAASGGRSWESSNRGASDCVCAWLTCVRVLLPLPHAAPQVPCLPLPLHHGALYAGAPAGCALAAGPGRVQGLEAGADGIPTGGRGWVREWEGGWGWTWL